MGLQDQVFKNCKKGRPPYKERGSNLDKCLSPYLSIIYKRIIKYPPLIYLESKCKAAFDLLVFHHGF